MKKLSVAIVLLNYNSLDYFKAFLPTLVRYSNEKIYIIDNCSTDNSKEFVLQNYPMIQWIQLNDNYGFAGGYYHGLKEIQEDIFILLNSDVEVTENWIQPIKERFQNEEQLGACQPKILSQRKKTHFEYAGAAGGFMDYLGYPFCRGRVFDSVEKDNGQYDNVQDCFWASGCALFIRKDAYFKAGELDYRFFAHQEEIDLCWRLQKVGYKVSVEPTSIVYHVGGGTLNYKNPKKTYYNFRNNLILLEKNLEQKQANEIIQKRMLMDCFAVLKELISFRTNHAQAIVNAYFDFFKQRKEWRKQFTISSQSTVKHIYSHSVIYKYFFQRKKTYQELR